MDFVKETRRQECLELSHKLETDLKQNKEEAGQFFGGEILVAYAEAVDRAIEKIDQVQFSIKNL